MTEVNVTPELRFPDFENGIHTQDYLFKFCEVNPTNGELPEKFIYIDLESVNAGRLEKENEIYKDQAPSRAQRILTFGDILYQTVRPYQRNNYHFKLEGDYVASTGYAQIRNPDCPEYYYQLFHTDKFVNKVLRRCTGTSYPAINSTDLEKIPIIVPQNEEQQKIASFLTAVDERIQLLQKKKAKLEEYKKGVMQQLFAQQIRFKDEHGNEFPDWEEKKLGEICNKQSSNISANSLEESGGDFKIYGATGFLQFVDFYREEEPYISIVKDGAGVGRILLCEAKSSVLGTLDILKPKEENNIKFLYALISNIRFEKYITGSTIPHIYFKDYSKEKINVPIPAEQHKIAAFLTSLDDSIESIGVEIEGSIEYKKGLLQKMFV